MTLLKKANSISVFGIKVSLLTGVGIFLILTTVALAKMPNTLEVYQPMVLAANIVPNNPVVTDSLEIAKIKQRQETIPLPVSQALSAPELTAASVLVEDLDSHTVLFAKDPDKRVAIASTTKIMTAMVALKYYQPTSILQVKDLNGATGSIMGLRLGERLTFDSLLYGLLLPSGNDAAFTLAENYPGGVSGFVASMNQQAKNLGLLNTHFDNPAGFDSLSHYSSAWDLSKIAQQAITDPNLAKVVATKQTTVASVDNSVIHSLQNVNKLLGEPGVLGIKTGYTPEAKENLVGLFDRNGHRILTVVLGSDDRFGETDDLVSWVYKNFTWSK